MPHESNVMSPPQNGGVVLGGVRQPCDVIRAGAVMQFPGAVMPYGAGRGAMMRCLGAMTRRRGSGDGVFWGVFSTPPPPFADR